jgi:phosphopantetheinyl transferase
MSEFCTSFQLEHHGRQFTAALCISRHPLEQLKRETKKFLHDKEQAYFDTLQYPKRQHSYLLGRYCAKQAVSSYLQNESMTSTLIENGVFHQPIVYHSHPTDVQVSISHTDSLGIALAFPAPHPMGIDVEIMNEANAATIQTQLTLAEQQKASQFLTNQPLFFTLLWTVKEALSKALKCGLTIPLEILEVEEIKQKESCWTSSFKHFQQYEACSFLLAETICSMVYPKGSRLCLDIKAIQQIISQN